MEAVVEMTTEPASYSLHQNVVVVTYGRKPCPHCYDERVLEPHKRVYWTIPHAVTLALAGVRVAVCAECVKEELEDELE
jgi:hypothetical protein